MTSPDTQSEADVIKLAYAMAVGPHRYEEMNDVLHARLEAAALNSDTSADADGMDAAAVEAFKDLEPHFGNAHSLMTMQGRKFDTITGSISMVDSDDNPAILLSTDATIFHANKAAQETFGLKIGGRLSRALFERGEYDELIKNLMALDNKPFDNVLSVFGLANVDGSETVKIALRKTLNASGNIVAYLSAINTRWLPGTAKEFKKIFKLTSTEISITQAVVQGVAMTELAERRGRAVGTVRQQMKALLKKLNLRSQTELACLYSGFAEIHANSVKSVVANQILEPWRAAHILLRPNGRILNYEIVGNSAGRPVLFFPALIGGNALTEEMRALIKREKLRLIMVWRPMMASSGPDGSPELETMTRYAHDIDALLDELGITSCPIMGHVTSSVFAFGCAKYIPNRVSGLLLINGVVPCWSGPHVRHLDIAERLRLFMARHVPKVGELVVQAFISRIDAGFDEEVTREMFKKSPLDFEMVSTNDEIKVLFRKAYSITARQGYDFFMHEFKLISMNWADLTTDLDCPVSFLVGAENFGYIHDLIDSFGQDKNRQFNVVSVEGAAHLLFYQCPEVVFSHISEMVT